MVQAVSHKIKESFIPITDWFTIIILAIIGTSINNLPYNNNTSTMLQIMLMVGLFILYRKRPAMMIVAYILLSILPTRMYGGFINIEQLEFYRINDKICISLSILYLLHCIFVLKKKFKFNITNILFSVFMLCSISWTVSNVNYDINFLWICVAYLLLPLFIKDDIDLKSIFISYIIAMNIFAFKALEIIITHPMLYRGTVNLNPNYASFILVIGITVIFTLFMKYKSTIPIIIKIFLLESVILFIIAMAFFASRSSFLMLLILIFLFFIFSIKNIKSFILPLVGIVILSIVLFQNKVFNTLLLRFTAGDDDEGGGRLIIQQKLLDNFFSSDIFHYLFGNGYLTAVNFGFNMQAHNSYISIIVGFGMIGIFLYFAYLVSIFETLKNSNYKSFLILLIILCLYGFAIEPYHIPEGIIFFCLLSGVGNIQLNSITLNSKNQHTRNTSL